LKAVLFDLDGTLLENEVDRFMPAYFQLLASKYKDLCPPDQFVPALIEASEAMVRLEHPDRTNKDVFWPIFLERTGMSKAEAEALSDHFYREHFPKLARLTRPIRGVRTLLQDLHRNGYTLVVATNPLFPAQAILERLRWARVNGIDFALVTSYENMHATKPHRAYYQEILAKIGLPAEEALMVGNSLEDDMVAKKVGLSTYYVHPPHSIGPSIFSPLVDRQGSLLQLRPFLLN
jgi:HAD superfamily hydrolase (TIGR01549 family)